MLTKLKIDNASSISGYMHSELLYMSGRELPSDLYNLLWENILDYIVNRILLFDIDDLEDFLESKQNVNKT